MVLELRLNSKKERLGQSEWREKATKIGATVLPFVSREAILSLTRPATIPRARAWETEAKAFSYHSNDRTM